MDERRKRFPANGFSSGAALADLTWPLAVVLASTAGLVALDRTVAPGVARPLAHLPSVGLAVILVADLAVLVVVWHRLVRRMAWGDAYDAVRRTWLRPDRLVGLMFVAMLTRWLLLTAVGWKSAIPAVHPFCCDVMLARLDVALVGRSAWEWLDPVTRSPLALGAIEWFYYGWFVAFAYAMLHYGWAEPGQRRRRFLTGMCLVWVVGSLAGILVSSAGPIYYSRVVGPHPSFDLLASRVVALGGPAAEFQALLWERYQAGAGSTVAGIAAFPSLHVAVPAYLVLADSPRRQLWVALTAFTAIGSVLLGWHYLVDTPGAFAVALVAYGLAELVP